MAAGAKEMFSPYNLSPVQPTKNMRAWMDSTEKPGDILMNTARMMNVTAQDGAYPVELRLHLDTKSPESTGACRN
jgi:hypothetical protein